MAYRYLNPGYGDLFEQAEQTSLQETNAGCTTGVCFYSSGTRYLPAPPSGTKEIWAKFEVLKKNNNGQSDILSVKSQSKNGVLTEYCFCRAQYGCFYIKINGTEKAVTPQKISSWQKVLIHVKSDATNGIFEIYENDILTASFYGNVLNGEEITQITSESYNEYVKLSNIIISDSEVKTTENVYVVPTTISATMTDNRDGTYTADAVSEYVNMTPNIPSGAIPTGAKITGYAVAARNAYYDGDGLNKLDVTKDGANIGEFTLDTTDTTSNIIGFTQNMDVSVFAASVYGLRAKN